MSNLTKEEQDVMFKLADAWNGFVKLDLLHRSDREDFMRAIHAAQNIVLARPELRTMTMVMSDFLMET